MPFILCLALTGFATSASRHHRFWVLRSCIFFAVIFELAPVNCYDHFWVLSETFFETNSFLSNLLNKIHPPLFFILICSLPWTFVSSFPPLTFINLKWNLPVMVLSFTLLGLGAWWAYQEGTWGGWWNWDASENLALLILIVNLLHFHIAKIHQTRILASMSSNILLFFALMLFSILQLSFSDSAHSFGIRYFHLFSPNNLFIAGAVLLLGLLFLKLLVYTFLARCLFTNTRQIFPIKRHVFAASISLCLFFLILIAFFAIQNDSRFLSVSSFFSTHMYSFFTPIALFVLVITSTLLFHFNKLFPIQFSLILINFSPTVYIGFFSIKASTFLAVSHLFFQVAFFSATGFHLLFPSLFDAEVGNLLAASTPFHQICLRAKPFELSSTTFYDELICLELTDLASEVLLAFSATLPVLVLFLLL